MRETLLGASSAAAYFDPALPTDYFHPDSAFNYTMQLVGQELNVPIMNGSSGRVLAGYPPVMTPPDVSDKKDQLNLQGFVYLVPRVKEQELAHALRENRFLWRESRKTFSVYVLAETPGPPQRVRAPVFLPRCCQDLGPQDGSQQFSLLNRVMRIESF
jgi:hypothetical protein